MVNITKWEGFKGRGDPSPVLTPCNDTPYIWFPAYIRKINCSFRKDFYRAKI